MSGHNKWSKIKHKKAATDAVKSKVFSKYVKLIYNAVKESNGDIKSPSVLTIVEKAKKENMPKENIERALKKASEKGASMEKVIYEGFGPEGVGIIVEAYTDNKNRTSPEIKHIFTKEGLSLGAPGSVSWAFSKNEDNQYTPNEGTEIDLSEDGYLKLENLINQFEEHDDVTDVFTSSKED